MRRALTHPGILAGVFVALLLAGGCQRYGEEPSQPLDRVEEQASGPRAKPAPIAVGVAPEAAKQAARSREAEAPESARFSAPDTERHDAILRRLEDPNPGSRAAAIASFPAATREDFELIADVLAADPDADVRVEAAEQLAFAESPHAIETLIYTLGDPEPQVVVAAIEALEMAGDETTIPHLLPLLGARDDDVRAAAVEAVEALQ